MSVDPSPVPGPEEASPDTSYEDELVRRSTIGQQLTPEDYEALRGIAHQLVRGWRASPTLNATQLVHDAWMRASDKDDPGPLERRRYVAQIMRNLLRDRARRKQSEKHGGGAQRVSIHSGIAGEVPRALDLLDLDQALETMERASPELYAVVHLDYFGGLSRAELARTLGASEPTIRKRLALGHAWLQRRLEGEGP